MDISEIRSLYAEFMGYFNQAPQQKENPAIYNSQMWEQVNKSIKRLSEVSSKNYDDFLIRVDRDESLVYVETMVYRLKLGGLISKLHAEYFPTLPEPFSGKPSIVISQSQQQNQQVFIQILLDLQSKIDEKLPSLPEGSKQKTFFQKLKGSLSATTGIVDLLNKIFTFAKECGVPNEELMKLFS